MAPDEFFSHLSANGIGVEFAVATRDVGMENDLYHDVAKFFFQSVRIGIFDRLQHFVSFFEKIRSQRLMCLLRIPRATVRIPERADRVDQELEVVLVVCVGWNWFTHRVK